MTDKPNLWLRRSHDRHPELYEAEYAKQLDRIARIRTSVSASIPRPPDEPPPRVPAKPAPRRWDEWPSELATAAPAPGDHTPRPAPPAPAAQHDHTSPSTTARLAAAAPHAPRPAPPAAASVHDHSARLRPAPPEPAGPSDGDRPFAVPAAPSPRDPRRGAWAPPDHTRGPDAADVRPGARRHRRRVPAVAAVVAVLAGLTAVLLVARDSEIPMVGTTFRLAGQPTGIAVSGTRVWVAGPAAGSVWILDSASGRPAAPALRTGGTPARVTVTDRWAWIADTQSGALLRAATRGDPLIRTLPAGPDVTDVAVAAGAVWSTSSADGTVRVRASRGATRVLHVGSRPLALAADGRWVVAADTGAGTLVRLSATTRRVAGPPIRLGGAPVDVALVDEAAWVVDSAAGTVQTVDVELGTVAPPVALCATPVAVAADRADVYVLCRGDRTLVRLDPSTGRVRARGRLAHPPTALALDPRHVWIAAGDHEVIRVDR